ncbi:hypothetical protein VULLAG_LOCUS207 [Vulpes lagopus]
MNALEHYYCLTPPPASRGDAVRSGWRRARQRNRPGTNLTPKCVSKLSRNPFKFLISLAAFPVMSTTCKTHYSNRFPACSRRGHAPPSAALPRRLWLPRFPCLRIVQAGSLAGARAGVPRLPSHCPRPRVTKVRLSPRRARASGGASRSCVRGGRTRCETLCPARRRAVRSETSTPGARAARGQAWPPSRRPGRLHLPRYPAPGEPPPRSPTAPGAARGGPRGLRMRTGRPPLRRPHGRLLRPAAAVWSSLTAPRPADAASSRASTLSYQRWGGAAAPAAYQRRPRPRLAQ